MDGLQTLARGLTEEHFGNELEVGRRFLYRADGTGPGVPIEITGGAFWGMYGLSNFWHWKVIGTGETGSGYGGQPPYFELIS